MLHKRIEEMQTTSIGGILSGNMGMDQSSKTM